MSIDVSEAEIQAFDSANPLEVETAPAAAVETPPATETPAATPAATPKQSINLNDDDEIDVKVDGQIVKKTWKEILQTQAMLPSAFTKKSQALAQERQAFEAERTQIQQAREQAYAYAQAQANEVAQIKAYLNDPQKLSALYLASLSGTAAQQGANGQAAPAAPQAPQFDPAAFQQQILAQAQQYVQQSFAQQQQQAASAAQAKALEDDITAHTHKLLTKQPALQDLDGIDDLLIGQVVKMRPASMDEAKQMLSTVVDGYAEKLAKHITTTQKVAAVAAAKAKEGIAPKGGSAIPATPKTYNKKRGLNDPAMDADVLAFINAQST